MNLAESLKYLRNIQDQKLIYLYLLRHNHSPYRLVKKKCNMETPERQYTNVQRLVELGLLYPHPYLTVKEPTKEDIKRAKPVSLAIQDDSYRAVLWSVGEYDKPSDIQLTDKECLIELRRLAQEYKEEIRYWESVKYLAINW